MGFVGYYLLGAAFVCSFCTLVVVWRCSCDAQSPPHLGLPPQSGAAAAWESRGSARPPVSTRPKTFLLFLIMSSPNETAVRAVVRDTWLKLSKKGPSVFRHVFPLGTKGMKETLRELLDEEQKLHGDLAFIDDMEEDYSKLTSKTLKSITYAVANYDFEYVMKVDTDSYVRVGGLLKALRDIAHPRLYWGFLDGRAKPFRKGKWKESDWIICDRYLPYQLGGGYVLSYSLADYLARNAGLFRMYKSEDVSVGAWLAGLDVRYVHDPRFDTEWQSRGCNNEYLVTHEKTPQELESLHRSMIQSGVLCEKEYRTRWSYVYDWAVPPSQCCSRQNGSRIP